MADGDPDWPRRMTAVASDVRLVPARELIVAPIDVVFRLTPGDRPLVAAGESVVIGAPIAERLRDPWLDEAHVPEDLAPKPGGRWHGQPDDRDGIAGGELVFAWR